MVIKTQPCAALTYTVLGSAQGIESFKCTQGSRRCDFAYFSVLCRRQVQAVCAGLKLLQGLASNCTQLVGVLIIFVLTSSRQTRPEVGDLLVVIGEASLVLGELDVKTACSGFIRSESEDADDGFFPFSLHICSGFNRLAVMLALVSNPQHFTSDRSVGRRRELFATWERRILPKESGAAWSWMSPWGRTTGPWLVPGTGRSQHGGPAGLLRGLGAKLLRVWEGELVCWVGCYKWGGRVQF